MNAGLIQKPLFSKTLTASVMRSGPRMSPAITSSGRPRTSSRRAWRRLGKRIRKNPGGSSASGSLEALPLLLVDVDVGRPAVLPGAALLELPLHALGDLGDRAASSALNSSGCALAYSGAIGLVM